MAFGLEIRSAANKVILGENTRIFRRIGSVSGVAASQVGQASYSFPSATADGTTFAIVFNSSYADCFRHSIYNGGITVYWQAEYDLGLSPVTYTVNLFKG